MWQLKISLEASECGMFFIEKVHPSTVCFPQVQAGVVEIFTDFNADTLFHFQSTGNLKHDLTDTRTQIEEHAIFMAAHLASDFFN